MSTKKSAAKKKSAKLSEPIPAPIAEETVVSESPAAPTEEPAPAPVKEKDAAPAPAPVEEKGAEPAPAPAPVEEAPAAPVAEPMPEPRRSVAFIGSECYPFVKTGGLGDVMYALPKALIKQNCDVKVILPRYKCIPQKYQDKMIFRGDFTMDLCADGRSYYVGIMEYVWDGVVYDFIDNEEFFSWGNPYTNLVDDIPKFCYFAKAALAALNYMNWVPDIIHCHDWQAALVPVYLRTLFNETPLANSQSVLTIHNLRFQGIYDIKTIQYWTGLPDGLFDYAVLKQNYNDANMLKGGLAYATMITTVSNTYAGEIQTGEYGENLDAHLRFHSGKLRGIVNGIDCEQWDSATDPLLAANYDKSDAVEKKKANKRALQEQLGLQQDEGKFVIGLISRLTDQKGLDLINFIFRELIDGNTQVVVLGTGDKQYEDAFRYYENEYKGSVCSNIMYDEGRAHMIYAGCDALLVPSRFEPCGLTQLIAMRYGTVPIVRETGGLKDTVQPYNEFTNEGNGFTFDRYEAGLLLDAINRAKTVYFTERGRWDEMVRRNMEKDVSWENSAKQYRALYLDLKP
ncbi:MAG: glycogen/starch synthase [Oscillibacter sp.]|nr:glycogen/starch synthase [Oscillibacter sp.]